MKLSAEMDSNPMRMLSGFVCLLSCSIRGLVIGGGRFLYVCGDGLHGQSLGLVDGRWQTRVSLPSFS